METTLYYAEQGSGTPLILLHGNGESGEYFKNQIDFFSTSYRVIAIDTRGHGKSSRGTAPFTLEQFAEDVKALLDKLKINRAHFLGFSDGGNIALLFALRYPHRVARLTLNGANLNPRGVKAQVQIPICIGYAIVSFLSWFDKKAIPKKEILGLMVRQPHIAPESLKKLSMPVLVLVGDKDMIKASHSRAIARALPQGQLLELAGDHFIAAKNPEAYNQAVLAFLKQG